MGFFNVDYQFLSLEFGECFHECFFMFFFLFRNVNIVLQTVRYFKFPKSC